MNELGDLGRAVAPPAPEELYLRLFGRLVAMAWTKFGVPESAAADLAHDVFIRWMTGRERILDAEAWLAVAMFNECRQYLERQRKKETREASPDFEASVTPEDIWQNRLVARQAVAGLTPRGRVVLVMHYLEGRTAAEVADALGTTVRYAEKLIHKNVRRARAILALRREQT